MIMHLYILLKDAVWGAGYTLILIFKTILSMRYILDKRHEIIDQMHLAGISSLFVVSIVGVFTGMIMTLNTGLGLKDFGAEGQVGILLIVTLTREMSPFMTALILAASVGSAIAAEIGTMKVSEEIDALNIMSIDHVKYLVLPRILGFSLMVPVLSVYSTALGLIGGAIVGHFQLGIDVMSFYQDIIARLSTTAGLKDLHVGLLKAFIFGITISSVACSHGLRTTNGAIGVWKTTRVSVVTSFLLVIFLGYVVTAIFYK